MDYADYDPHYDVNTLRQALQSMDSDAIEALRNGGGVISSVEGIDLFRLTPDDILIIRDLAERDEY